MWLSGLLIKSSSLHPKARETNENLTKCVPVCHWSTGLFYSLLLYWPFDFTLWPPELCVTSIDTVKSKTPLDVFSFLLVFFSNSNCFPHRQQFSAISSNSDDYICKRSVSVTQKDWQTVLWALMHSLYITWHAARGCYWNNTFISSVPYIVPEPKVSPSSCFFSLQPKASSSTIIKQSKAANLSSSEATNVWQVCLKNDWLD